MTFLEKFTKDTMDGMWDAEWGYKDGSKIFSFTKPKHYLSGLTLGFNSKDSEIIFPNGYSIICKKEELSKLIDAILVALERRVDKCTQDYLAGVSPIKETDKKDPVEDPDTSGDGVR